VKFQIYVFYHKLYDIVQANLFFPLQVGKKTSKVKLPIQGDDTVENISHLNYTFNELTGIYWIWKNSSFSDYIGAMHYRRFLLPLNIFQKIIYPLKRTLYVISKITHIELIQLIVCGGPLFQYNITSKKMNKIVGNQLLYDNYYGKYDVILPVKELYLEGIRKQYVKNHSKDDLYILEKIIKTELPDFWVYYEKSMNDNVMYPCNMFIMKKDVFESFSNLIFKILLKMPVEQKNDNYQNRYIGFLSERLMLPFIQYFNVVVRKIKIKEIPITFLKE